MENETNYDSGNNSSDSIKIVKDTKKELSDYRKPQEKDWKEYDDSYYGKQNKHGNDEIKTVKNHVFKIIEGEIPLLTDSLSSTSLTATKENKQAAADMLEKAITFVHKDQNLPLILPSLMRSALTSAPGYLYVSYNPDADGGEGKIEYHQVPWKGVFLDGNVSSIEQSEKFHIDMNKRRDCLARTWPEKADEIKALVCGSNDASDTSEGKEKRDDSTTETNAGKPKAFKSKDILVYSETWIKNYDLIDIDPKETQEAIQESIASLKKGIPPEVEKWENHEEILAAVKQLRAELLSSVGLDPQMDFEQISAKVEELLSQNPQAQGLQDGLRIIKIIDNNIEERESLKELNPTSQEPKFKDGWRVIKAINAKIIVYDGENPEEGGLIPIVPFYGYKDDTIYGFGAVKNIINAQRSLNDMDFREFEGLKVCSNSGWIADHGAFAEGEKAEEKLTNKPGIVVTKNKGYDIRRLEYGKVSPQLGERKAMDQQSMESIEGMNEQSMNGAATVGNTSALAIKEVRTQPIGRIRLKGRTLDYYSMRRLALIDANLIKNHWTQEKTLRLRADDNTIEEIIFSPEELEDLEYSVDIAPGSMAGVDKDALIAFYLMLLNNKHISFDMFLAACPDFPGKHTLVKMNKEANVQGQQIQQAQQAYEAQIQQVSQQMEEVHAENLKLKKAHDLKRQASVDLLGPDERKLADMVEKKNQIEKLIPNESAHPHDEMAKQWAAANPDDPRSQMIMQHGEMNGV